MQEIKVTYTSSVISEDDIQNIFNSQKNISVSCYDQLGKPTNSSFTDAVVFQFLYGTIKVACVHDIESQFMHISIPLWYD